MTVGPGDLSFAGKVIAVTGAAQGIGRATALAFARFGAPDLVACDVDGAGLETLAAELEATGARLRHDVLDVRDHDAVARFFATVGPLDVLVNNAGGTYAAGFGESSPKGDETLVREDLLSAVWCTRAALPQLADGGSVVNVTSIEAHRAAPMYAVYAAAKAGLANLTMTLALELGERGIRVNAVAPDVIPTPGCPVPEDAWTALGRVGAADEVAAAIVFLASPLASFITGTTLHVDGGTSAAGGWRRTADGRWTT